MIGWIIYLVCTFIIGVALSFVTALFRPLPSKLDTSPVKSVLVCFFIAIAGPFIYVETVTKSMPSELPTQISKAFADSDIDGPMLYYKVIWRLGDHASAIAVGQERTKWGGTDRPVLRLKLERVDGNWKVVGTEVIVSERLDRDSIVLPPYR